MRNTEILHISVRFEADSFNSPNISKLRDMFTSVYPLFATPVSYETIPWEFLINEMDPHKSKWYDR